MHLHLKMKDQKLFSKANPKLLCTTQKKLKGKQKANSTINKPTKHPTRRKPTRQDAKKKRRKDAAFRPEVDDALFNKKITTLPKLSVTDRELLRKQPGEPLLISASAELNKSFS